MNDEQAVRTSDAIVALVERVKGGWRPQRTEDLDRAIKSWTCRRCFFWTTWIAEGARRSDVLMVGPGFSERGLTGEILATQMETKPWFVVTIDGVFWLRGEA